MPAGGRGAAASAAVMKNKPKGGGSAIADMHKLSGKQANGGNVANQQRTLHHSHTTTADTIEELLWADCKKIEAKPLHWFLDHKGFIFIVFGMIVLNAIQMGLSVDHPHLQDIWDACDHFFNFVFLIEMGIKLYFLGKGYFQDGWNRMDCLLVSMSILDSWVIKPLTSGNGEDNASVLGQLSVLRLIRIFRVARLARLLKVFKELWIILKGIIESLRTMFWVSCLLLLTLYVSSILCVDELGRDTYWAYEDDEDIINASLSVGQWNNYVYFGTITRSMYTLFNVVIMAEWSEIGRPAVERKPSMILFFILFIVFTTFGILNVIIGVIVDNTMEAAKSREEENKEQEQLKKLELLTQIRDMVFSLDTDGSGSIAIEELREGWNQPLLQNLLENVNLPKAFSPQELLHLMDNNSDEELSYSEFMKSFYRLITGDHFQQNCCMHASLNSIKVSMKGLQGSVSGMSSRLESLEAKVDAALAGGRVNGFSSDAAETVKPKVQKANPKPIRDKQQVHAEKANQISREPPKRQAPRQNVQTPRNYPEPTPMNGAVPQPYEHHMQQYSGDPHVPPPYSRALEYYDPRVPPPPGPGYYEYSRPSSAPPVRRRGPPGPPAPIWYEHYEQHPYVLPQAHVPYPGPPVFLE
jgi:voltage-gated sodium channel